MRSNSDKREERQSGDERAALPLVAPFVVIYALLFVYPAAQVLLLSFTSSGLIRPGEWVGIEHYLELATDRRFWTAVRNTAYFVALTVIPGTVVGLGLALLVQRLSGIVQAAVLAVFFVPYVLPVSSVTSMFWYLGQTDVGGFQPLLHLLTGRDVAIWRELPWFLPSIAVMTIWWTSGFNILLFLAALRAVPKEIHEAAALDGAGRWSRFTRITLPLIVPTILLIITLQLILQLKVFDQVYLMIGGGRIDALMVLVQYIYILAFQRDQGGYGATVAVALLVIVALVTLGMQWQLRRVRGAT